MTYEEIIASINHGEYQPYAHESVDNKIIEALEMQIPKKPSVQWNADRIYSWNTCPICGRGIEEKYNFCPNCGQKIDWSE